jgi:hypothetical protein
MERFSQEWWAERAKKAAQEDPEDFPLVGRPTGKRVSLKTTLQYFGEDRDEHGMPSPWFTYLLIASDVPGVGCVSTIMPVTSTPGPIQPHHVAPTGGNEEAALSTAEKYLDHIHQHLKKRRAA